MNGNAVLAFALDLVTGDIDGCAVLGLSGVMFAKGPGVWRR